MRIIAFVDHEIGYILLKKLIFLSHQNRLQICAVVTTEENEKSWWPAVKKICASENLQLFTYSANFNEINQFENIDYYFLLSWKFILPKTLFSLPKKGTINLHYSLLPNHRGTNPVNWAIINGDEFTGITYHFVNEDIDSGSVILQKKIKILLSDTARTLQLRLDKLACDLFDDLIEIISQNKFSTKPSEETKNPVTVYNSKDKFNKICQIDLKKNYTGLEFYNLLRGLTFLENSKNGYIFDIDENKKIYIHLNIGTE